MLHEKARGIQSIRVAAAQRGNGEAHHEQPKLSDERRRPVYGRRTSFAERYSLGSSEARQAVHLALPERQKSTHRRTVRCWSTAPLAATTVIVQ